MDEITMTEDELRRVQDELHQLEGPGRAGIAAQIKTAREWGDLKENAEYHAAKEAQAHLETRILKLRAQVRAAVIVETGGSEDVQHGSVVTVTDLSTQSPREFKLVSPHDANPAQGQLSASSPIAQALLGHRVSDVVEVRTPAGLRRLRIDAIA